MVTIHINGGEGSLISSVTTDRKIQVPIVMISMVFSIMSKYEICVLMVSNTIHEMCKITLFSQMSVNTQGTHTHIHAHMYMHTCTHAHMYTCTHIACTRAQKHKCTYAHMHTCT